MCDKLAEIRCSNCRALLLEANLKDGIIKKICPRCKTINVITAKPAKVSATPVAVQHT